MPRVDLEAGHDKSLMRTRDSVHARDKVGWDLGRQKRHEVTLRVGDDRAERISLDHIGQLLLRPDQYNHLEPESVLDEPVDLPRDAGCRGSAPEDDDAARHV